MLITLTVRGPHASQVGFLFHKHPGSVLEREFSAGTFVVFYPRVEPDCVTVALLVRIDTVNLTRSTNLAASYVDHRPYAASSFTAVALHEAFDTALQGKSTTRPDLVTVPLPVEVVLAAIVCRGGEQLIRELFEPLGYTVAVRQVPFGSAWLANETSPVYEVTLAGAQTIQRMLQHLYVLLPLMEKGKHYFVDQSEIEKLLRHGGGWLETHPRRDWITARYLFYRRDLIEQALERLSPEDRADRFDEQREEDHLEQPLRLRDERLQTALAVLRGLVPPVGRVGDLGCGEGLFIKLLADERAFEHVVGIDVSSKALEIAARRLRLERRKEWQRPRVELLHGSLLYQDQRLRGLDALVLLEVLEHLEEERLDLVAHNLFEFLTPAHVVVTTPNREYNRLFPRLSSDALRHPDHRFEWTRGQFHAWVDGISARYGYAARHLGIGPVDPSAGAPTQLAVFTRGIRS